MTAATRRCPSRFSTMSLSNARLCQTSCPSEFKNMAPSTISSSADAKQYIASVLLDRTCAPMGPVVKGLCAIIGNLLLCLQLVQGGRRRFEKNQPSTPSINLIKKVVIV